MKNLNRKYHENNIDLRVVHKYCLIPALPNRVPAGIFLPAKAFLNARLDFCVSKPTKNKMFFTQNGLFSNNKFFVTIFLALYQPHFVIVTIFLST
jgi:hypothetical protein